MKRQFEQNENRLLLIILSISTVLFLLTIGFRTTNPSLDTLLKKQAIVQNVQLETTTNHYNDIPIFFNPGHCDFSNEKIIIDKKRVIQNYNDIGSTLSLLHNLKVSPFRQISCQLNQQIVFKLSVVLII